MRNSTYRRTLDVQEHGSQFTVNVVQGENDSRQLVLTIQDGGKPFDFNTNSLVAVFYAEKPDGSKEFTDEVARDGNKLTVTIPATMINVAGDVRGRIRIISGTAQVLYSPEFTIFVDACDIDDDSEEAEEYHTALVGALAEASNVDITASKTGDTATVTATDRDGNEHSVEIEDGFSPSASVARNPSDTGARITITDYQGTTFTDVYDGQGGGGGDSRFVVTYNVNSTTGELETQTSFSDILSAYNSGQEVAAVMAVNGEPVINFTLSRLVDDEEALFVAIVREYVVQLAHSHNNAIDVGSVVLNTLPYKFVETRPTVSIDTDTIYMAYPATMFPSATSYVTSEWGKIAVTYDETNGWRMIRFQKTNNNFYDVNTPRSIAYEIYEAHGASWYKIDEATDSSWTTKMGWTSNTVITDERSGYQNVYYSNSNFSYTGFETYKHYLTNNGSVTDSNRANLDGSTSNPNPYIREAWHYDGTGWSSMGVFDFRHLFADIESRKQDKLTSQVNIKSINGQSLLGSGDLTIGGSGGTVDTSMSDSSTNAVQNKVIKGYVDNGLATKADAATTYTKTEVDSLISSAIADVSTLIGEVPE